MSLAVILAVVDETGEIKDKIAYYRTEKQQKAWQEKSEKGYCKHMTCKGEHHFVQA